MHNTIYYRQFPLYVTRNKNVATIHVGENFNFPSHIQFTEAFSELLKDTDINIVEVDLASVSHLDSSALGMLLLLRERISKIGKSLSLVSPSPLAKSALDIANFHKLFSIRFDS